VAELEPEQGTGVQTHSHISSKSNLQELQLKESVLCPPTVDDEKDPECHLEANPDLANPESARRPARMIWWHRVRKVFAHLPARAHRRSISVLPQAELDVLSTRDRHTFVDAIFSKRAFAPRSRRLFIADYHVSSSC